MTRGFEICNMYLYKVHIFIIVVKFQILHQSVGDMKMSVVGTTAER